MNNHISSWRVNPACLVDLEVFQRSTESPSFHTRRFTCFRLNQDTNLLPGIFHLTEWRKGNIRLCKQTINGEKEVVGNEVVEYLSSRFLIRLRSRRKSQWYSFDVFGQCLFASTKPPSNPFSNASSPNERTIWEIHYNKRLSSQRFLRPLRCA